MSKDIILRTEDLRKYFRIKGGRVVKAVDGVSIEVERGKTLGLVGESGCGKSTLGRTIIRIYDPTDGKLILNGKDISGKSSKRFRQELARSIQMIFQDPYACLDPRMTVTDLIAEGWDLNRSIHLSAAERQEKVVELLKIVGLNEEHAGRFPHEFSGGQRQRIGIARAIALNPEFLVCDEPVSALDVSVHAQILNLLMDLQKELGITYLFISHNLAVVKDVCSHVAVMYLGSIMETGATEDVFRSAMHPYTRSLLSAVLTVDVDHAPQRIILEGNIPSPINTPSGCPFSTRCPYAREECKKEKPELRELEKGHFVACHFPMMEE